MLSLLSRSIRSLPTGLLALALFALGATASRAQQATDPDGPATEVSLRVELASGRQFVGQIDPQTDDEHLYLRTIQGPMILVRPIEWASILRAHIAGQTVTGLQLRSVVAAVRKEHPNLVAAALPQSTVRVSVANPAPPVPASAPSRAIRSLALEAWTANWDADVEDDGLVVSVYALDDEGRIAPVDGTLEVELVTSGPGIAPDPASFVQIGRWVRRVRPGDFVPGGSALDGARYRLEYQAIHPEFDRRVAARGLVHARLSVPGHGVFEATAAMVRIRPYSAPRDWLEQATGRRFLPNERVGLAVP